MMSDSVQSIERAFAILDILGNADYHLGVSHIAELSNLPISTTYRLLATLHQLGYVEKNTETNKYTLGVRLLHLRGAVIERLNLGEKAMPVMKDLMRQINETVHLAVLDKGEVVYIERVEGLGTQGMYTRIGKRAPAHCTALGKVLLAYLPEEIWYEDVIERHCLKRFSPTTITTLETLRTELQSICARGYAIDNGESGEPVRCVAAPVRDYTGSVVAAVSISGPQTHITPDRVEKLGQAVCRAVSLISRQLGYFEGSESESTNAPPKKPYTQRYR
jgi:DNA-binding IclR family transcriptional regulator